MNAKERVSRTLEYQTVDRIPRYDIFLPEFISEWKRQKKLPDVNIYDFYSNIDICGVLGDTRGPFASKARILRQDGPDITEIDGFGRMLFRSETRYFEKQLAPAFTNKDEFDNLVFDDPNDLQRYESLIQSTKSLQTRFAPVSGVMGFFMALYRIRGEEQLLVDIAEDPNFVRYMTDRLCGFVKKQAIHVVRVTDTFDTALWIYDEFSSRMAPLFSPKKFESIFLPYYHDLCSHLHNNGIKHIILHCDGNCLPLYNLLIEAGFDGHQGPAPTTGMKIWEIKRIYGNRFSMVGGMCNIETLAHGSKNDIEHEASLILEAAESGGIIIGTHSIDINIPIQNYQYYYDYLDNRM